MKVLIINAYQNFGGTEVQVKRERDLLINNGHLVTLLTFDPNQPEVISQDLVNIHPPKQLLYRQIDKFFLTSRTRKLISSQIKKIAPDFVHINNELYYGAAIYRSLKEIPTLKTFRDYRSVCPMRTCIDYRGEICEGYMNANCVRCIGWDIKMQRVNIEKRFQDKIMKSAVDMYCAPSQALADKCTRNSFPTIALSNQFNFDLLVKHEKKFEKKIYLFYGAINEEKGAILLASTFSSFMQGKKDVELWFAGDIDESIRPKFLSYCSDDIKYIGKLSYMKIMEVYQQIYCVVVPSIILENYPNTVLEAMANKTLVIGSNRGGIPEMLRRKELLFDVVDINNIKKVLEYSYRLSKDEYIEITESLYQRTKTVNSKDKYYENLLQIVELIMSRK